MRFKICVSIVLALVMFAGVSYANDDNSPGKYTAEITKAEKLGQLIYEKDIAAWVATDKMLAELGDDISGLPLRGWVTDKDASRYRVNFIGENKGESKIYYQAWTKGKKVKKTKTHKQGMALSPKQMAMWSARKLAMAQKFKPCSAKYNTVVIPYDGGGVEKFYVYLFASTTDASKIVMGGHYRYTVSGDGKKILSNIAFSNSCLELGKNPDAAAIMVTHLRANTPQEHHVFISLSHGLSLYVAISKIDDLYEVSNGNIRMVEQD